VRNTSLDRTSTSQARDLLAELVGYASPSGSEGELADFVERWLADRGHGTDRLGNTVVARLAGDDPGPTLLLNSHLDTVPAGEGWTADPWAAEWTGDRLVGLGANDAKGCVAAMLLAFQALAESPEGRGSGRIVLSLHAEEETSNAGMGEYLRAFGPPDASITGEPTGLEVIRSQAGLAVLELVWRGRGCHAAHVARVEHKNALLLAARELAQLPDWMTPGPEHALLGASTVVVTQLSSGSVHNKVPDLAQAVVDARIVPPTTAEDCVEFLAQRLPRAEVRLRSSRLGPVDTEETDGLVACALRAAGKVRAVGSTTLSDMALLPEHVPAIKCGPGETARSHTPNEFLLESELMDGVRFYERCAREWMHAAGAVRVTGEGGL